MTRYYIAEVADFEDGNRVFKDIGGREIVVLKFDEKYFAFLNQCLHMGGPVGEGMIVPKVKAVLDEQQKVVREEFDKERTSLVCPWHGYEYELESGGTAPDGLRLPGYQVEVEESKVYVLERA